MPIGTGSKPAGSFMSRTRSVSLSTRKPCAVPRGVKAPAPAVVISWPIRKVIAPSIRWNISSCTWEGGGGPEPFGQSSSISEKRPLVVP